MANTVTAMFDRDLLRKQRLPGLLSFDSIPLPQKRRKTEPASAFDDCVDLKSEPVLLYDYSVRHSRMTSGDDTIPVELLS
jgi:hypothetical protein